MNKLLLAATTAFALSALPALAQDPDCPQGTDAATSGSSPVTCDNDDNRDDTTGMTDDTSAGSRQQDGSNPLSGTETGQGINDAVSGDGNGNGNK